MSSVPDEQNAVFLRSWAIRGVLAVAIIALLKAAETFVVPVTTAVVLTFVLAPAVRRLRASGIPEVFGAAFVVAALLSATVLIGAALAGPASRWWDRMPTTLAGLVERFDRMRASVPLLAPPAPVPSRQSRAAAAAGAQPPPDPIKEQIATEGVALTRIVLARLLTFTVSAVATIMLLYFLLASEHWMLARSVEAIPRRRTRALVLAGVRAAQQEISRFVGALAIVNLGVAVATAIAMWLLGLPNPALWGTVAGVLNFIPYIGPVMIAALLGLAGLVAFDTAGMMLAPAAAFMFVHMIESNFVSPWFVGRRLVLSPLAVFVAVMFFGWLWGIAGAMLAVPLLVVARSLCKRSRRLRLVCTYLEGGHDDAPTLRSLLRPPRRANRRAA